MTSESNPSEARSLEYESFVHGGLERTVKEFKVARITLDEGIHPLGFSCEGMMPIPVSSTAPNKKSAK